MPLDPPTFAKFDPSSSDDSTPIRPPRGRISGRARRTAERGGSPRRAPAASHPRSPGRAADRFQVPETPQSPSVQVWAPLTALCRPPRRSPAHPGPRNLCPGPPRPRRAPQGPRGGNHRTQEGVMSKLGSLHRLANADQGQIRPPVAGTAAQAAAGKGRAQRPVRMRRLVNWQSCGSCSSQKTRLSRSPHC